MPTATWERLDPARRDAVISAAAAEFTEHGFSSGSLNVIARNAGVAKGSLFQYFTDKADLYAYMAAQAAERIRTDIETLIAAMDWAADFWGSMLILLEQWQQYFTDHPLERAVTEATNLESERSARPAVRAAVNGHYVEVLTPLLEAGRAAGHLRADADLGAALALLILLLPHIALAPHNPGLDPILGLGDPDPAVRRAALVRTLGIVKAAYAA